MKENGSHWRGALATTAVALACSAVVDPDSLDEGCPDGKKLCAPNGRPQCVPDDSPEFGCREKDCGPCLFENATPTCNRGKCYWTECHAGYLNCDRVDDNGCEVDLAHDPKNCGECGIDCGDGIANAYVACSSGDCTYLCHDGFGDCDGNADNGCEVDLLTSDEYCGDCPDSACSSGETCRDGRCVSE